MRARRVAPARAHGERVLADRDRDAERRAQLPRRGPARCRTGPRPRAGSPQAAIQFAESLTSPSARTSAAAMFVIASPTAMRPEAGASSSAMAGRSPSAIASPVAPARPEVVTATSLTGTCQGPTSGSRLIMPPTLRSPIVTRKPLSATAGRRSRRVKGFARLDARRRRSRRRGAGGARHSSACAADGPSRSAIGMSTTRSPVFASSTTSRPSPAASPITA